MFESARLRNPTRRAPATRPALLRWLILDAAEPEMAPSGRISRR